MIVFIPEYGVVKGICYSFFHSISSFCNAGIDLFGSLSLQKYVSNPLLNIVTILLIFAGNLGFVVIWEITDLIKNRKRIFELSEHTKLVIVTSISLYLFYVLFVFFIEFSNVNSTGLCSLKDKILVCLFQGATVRTAGFATIPQSNLSNGSLILTIISMFIGGSPTGTSGGIKTTVVAILAITVIQFLQGKRNVEIYKKNIPSRTITTAFSVFALNIFIIVAGFLLLSISNNTPFLETLFEVISSVSTTGLSMGITPALNEFGKLILMLCMFIGRIGAITIVLSLNIKTRKNRTSYKLANGKFLMG